MIPLWFSLPRRLGKGGRKVIREREIESYLVKKVTESGGICWKLISPGNAGVPDRLVIIRGEVIFVELKAPGEQPRRLQEITIQKLKDQKQEVWVIDSKDMVDHLIWLHTRF